MMLSALIDLLSGDLDFHEQDSRYASHNFHSFPAKFPPQLPRTFISALTRVGDVVFDPMMGSGTTIVEAFLANRQAIGCDIDPLAVLLAQVKTHPLATSVIEQYTERLIEQAQYHSKHCLISLLYQLEKRCDAKTQKFLQYWFEPTTQMSLWALLLEIEQIEEVAVRRFFLLTFSSTIINSTGGVSLAIDLAHTRPHRAQVIRDEKGQIVVGAELLKQKHRHYQVKTRRSVFKEFRRRVRRNVAGLLAKDAGKFPPYFAYGNAQQLPLPANSVDLVVTSPPYPANAIDYMRTHKFSLTWLGYSIKELAHKRKQYIGSDTLDNIAFTDLPYKTNEIVAAVKSIDEQRGAILHRYYSEMTHVLRELYRVLKPNKPALVVVGSSVLRGKDTETHHCLAEIGEQVGLAVAKIGVRQLDRDRRLMPVSNRVNVTSQIQQRMHEEYVIGFYKPDK